jgi:hypothetical protein
MIMSRKFALYFCVVGAVILIFGALNERSHWSYMVSGACFLAIGLIGFNRAAKAEQVEAQVDEAAPPASESEEE